MACHPEACKFNATRIFTNITIKRVRLELCDTGQMIH